MKVLIACEYSGIVRDAFIEAGHDAISCDLLPTERPRATLPRRRAGTAAGAVGFGHRASALHVSVQFRDARKRQTSGANTKGDSGAGFFH